MNFLSFSDDSKFLLKLIQDFNTTNVCKLGDHLLKEKQNFLKRQLTIREDKIPTTVRSAKEQFTQILSATDLGYLFVEIDNFRNSLRKMPVITNYISFKIRNILSVLDSLWSKTTAMFTLKTIPTVYEFLSVYEELHLSLKVLDTSLQISFDLKEESITSPKEMTNLDTLDLGFYRPLKNIEELSLKLTCIKVMYQESCLIFNINENDYPLLIGKIETGSLWAKFFGNSKIVGFIVWFMQESIKYFHRNYTLEGKIGKIPVDLKILDEQFNFLEKLKESMPDDQITKESREALAKSAAILAKKTQILIEKEAKIRFEDEVYQIKPAKDNKYLKPGPKELNQNNEENNS